MCVFVYTVMTIRQYNVEWNEPVLLLCVLPYINYFCLVHRSKNSPPEATDFTWALYHAQRWSTKPGLRQRPQQVKSSAGSLPATPQVCRSCLIIRLLLCNLSALPSQPGVNRADVTLPCLQMQTSATDSHYRMYTLQQCCKVDYFQCSWL